MPPTYAPRTAKVGVPAKAADPTERRASIVKKQQQLGYDYATLPKLALAKGLPDFVELADAYTLERIDKTAPYSFNAMLTNVRRVFDVVNNMEDFEDYFIKLEAPSLVKDGRWSTDEFFAEQRLSGANPMIMKVLKSDDPRAKVLEDLDLPFTLRSELSGKNIYVCDYSGTSPDYRGPVMVSGGKTNSGLPQWLPKPIAYFRWVEDKKMKHTKGYLEPLAVHLDPSTDPVDYERKHSRVYTPNEEHPYDWMFAKICVQVADSLHHEMSSHLARCHFTMEPIAVASQRNFADEHPIALLINTHMRFHIANDSVAAYTLIGNGGNVDNLMPGTLRESMALLTEAYDKWDLIGMNFKNDLYNRDLANEDRLPHYPYRDDGNLIWDVLEEYVESYVNGVYGSDDDVANDIELQDFAAECANQDSGGRVKGMPTTIKSRNMLSEILTSIIFVCGPGHGAINFPQYEYMAFVPNMPLALYQDVHLLAEQKEPITQQQLMTILPTGGQAEAQLEIVHSLVAYKWDKFGNYSRTFMDWYGHSFEEHMKDYPAVVQAYRVFNAKLSGVENEINKRNKQRPNQYVYMKPSEMMNSISI